MIDRDADYIQNMRQTIFRKIIMLLAFGCLLAACKINADAILSTNQNLILQVRAKDSMAIKEVVLSPEAYQKLHTWLKQNERGWSSTPASFMPGIIVKGDKFSINFLRDIVILNYTDPYGNSHQLTKNCDPNDYAFLLMQEK